MKNILIIGEKGLIGNHEDPLHWVADISAIKKWEDKCKIQLAQGLKEYIKWAKGSG